MSLGSGGSMVARLKLKGIDRRAPRDCNFKVRFFLFRGNSERGSVRPESIYRALLLINIIIAKARDKSIPVFFIMTQHNTSPKTALVSI
jgi:hypothetical protein